MTHMKPCIQCVQVNRSFAAIIYVRDDMRLIIVFRIFTAY